MVTSAAQKGSRRVWSSRDLWAFIAAGALLLAILARPWLPA
jgi:hypothetical protein